jgi:hypothetical protein
MIAVGVVLFRVAFLLLVITWIVWAKRPGTNGVAKPR